MPGVPSGRGCEACRKQKKKCDQAKPSCGRCTRLQIDCKGSGERRYKFVQEHGSGLRSSTSSPASASASASASAPWGSRNESAQPSRAVSRQLSRSPRSNETGGMTGAFVWLLEVGDIRYGLGCYGPFLTQIPQRLGTNEALDASVGAMTSAFSSVYTRKPSAEALSKYVDALRALRVCLDDPAKRSTPDTLCAIYLVTICQTWLGKKDDQPTSHGEGLAIVLKTASSQQWQGQFEVHMVITLCLIVIVEALVNPNIQLDQWFPNLIEAYMGPRRAACEKNPNAINSIRVDNLANVPNLIRHPEEHLVEIKSMYHDTCLDVPKLRRIIDQLPQGSRMHCNMQAGLSLVLCLTLMFNPILRAFDPFDATLLQDAAIFTDEALIHAESSKQYRPLGASHVPVALVSALMATEGDPAREAAVEEMLADYQTDFAISNWREGAVWLKEKYTELRHKLGTRSRLEEPWQQGILLSESQGSETLKTTTSCCVQ